MQFRFTTKIKLYIVIGAIFLALVGSYFFLFREQIKQLMTLRGNLQQLETSFAKVKKDEAYLPKLEIEIVESKLKILTTHQHIPPDFDIAKIVDELSQLSNKVGIKDYNALTPLAPAYLKDYGLIPIKVSFTCKYSKFIDYLKGLDSLSFYTRVDDMILKVNETDPELININLSFVVFNMPDPNLK